MNAVATPALVPRPVRVAGASVCGVSHVRDGLPNQDALALWQAGANEQGYVVAAVADGHGGARHFRSAHGSRFAVDAALSAMRRIAAAWDAADAQGQTRIASSELPRAIVDEWTDQFRRHLESTPITDEEWETLAAGAGADARSQVEAETALAYGATLIAALVTSRQILLLQIGDGDALVVAPDGTASHPIPTDGRLTGEFTTSICRQDAAADFRHSIIAIEGTVALLMLATDGYSNSFRTDADFRQVGTDFLHMVRQDGVSQVEKRLPRILEHASANGSGDDITLAVVHLGETNRFSKARGGAAPSTMRVSEVRAELVSLKKQLQQYKKAVAAVAFIALATLAWTFRSEILAVGRTTPHGDPKTVPVKIKPGEASDTGSQIDAEAAPAAKISVSARHAAQSVKVSAKITFASTPPLKCTTEAALSAPGFPNLGTAQQPLAPASSKGGPIQLDATIAGPKEEKQRKALKGADAEASVEVICDGKSVAHATTRIAT
ncbi:MAG: PP2C family serine/threonine-protein phosphatase [Gammaproteobacteria bacterium]